jgi:hypothetical protein
MEQTGELSIVCIDDRATVETIVVGESIGPADN